MFSKSIFSLLIISTHAPAGGATGLENRVGSPEKLFLLTPLREGRRIPASGMVRKPAYFYSRPCGRGDVVHCAV